MKKFASLVASAALLGSGLVAASAQTATGAPYPGSVATFCRADNTNNPREGNPATVELRVTTGGNGAPSGRATFSYERKSNGVITSEFRRRYVGPEKQGYAFEGIPSGRYKVKVFFDSRPANSAYRNCSVSFDQRIRRGPR